MEPKPDPELRPDSELRDLVLRLLHKHSERKGFKVRATDFTPHITLWNIRRIGEQLLDMGFIKESPSQYPDSYWMRISTQGVLHAEQYL